MNAFTTFIEGLFGKFIAWGELLIGRLASGGVTILHTAEAGAVTFAADEWTAFTAFVAAAATAGADRSVAELDTAVLNLASASGANFVTDIATPIRQALIAQLQGPAASPPPGASPASPAH